MSLSLAPIPAPPLAGRMLTWRHHAIWTRPRWELVDGETVLITLARRHWYAHGLHAEVDGAPWKLGGWLAATLTIEDAEPPALRFGGAWWWHADETTDRLGLSRWRGDGPIGRADGRRWYWRQHGFIRERHWELLDERARVLATFTRRPQLLRCDGAVRIGDDIDSRADALEAAVFGWYLLLRECERRRHASAH